MIQWHSPWAFILLLPFLGIWFWTYWQRQKRTPSLQYANVNLIKLVKPTWRTQFKKIPSLLQALGIVMAICALARPQRMDTKIKRNVEGVDIVIALDISDSMLIEDMGPLNRLESAKETIGKFIQGRSSDRMGLVVFSGEAFTKVPLTLDYPLLLDTVKNIEITRTIKMGTAIGVALANASMRLKDSRAKSRIIIFMTDGENNSGTIDPETSLDIAKGFGLKIYSIGIGQDGETRLPIYTTDPFGNKVKRYQPFTSYVNEGLLGTMAEQTGGKFYRATKENSLEKIFSDIDRLEKTKVDINKYVRYEELFMPLAILALFFYALGSGLRYTVARSYP